MTQLDFSLGRPRNQIDVAGAVNTFLGMQQNKRAREEQERQRKEALSIKRLGESRQKTLMQSKNQETGQVNLAGAAEVRLGMGDLDGAHKFSNLANLRQDNLMKRREAFTKEKQDGADSFSRLYEEDPNMAAQMYDTVLKDKLFDGAELRMQDGNENPQTMAMIQNSISPKRRDRLAKAQPTYKERLTAEQTKQQDALDVDAMAHLDTLTTADFKDAESKKNLILSLRSQPYGTTKRVDKFLSDINRGKSMEESMASAFAGLDAYKNKKQYERKVGRSMTGEQQKRLSSIIGSASDFKRIQAQIEKIPPNYRGPIVGEVTGRNKYDVEIQKLKVMIKAAVPSLARGVFNEVGVLTDVDTKTYIDMFANEKSDPKVSKAKMDALGRKLSDAYNQTVKGYQTSKIDIGEFDPNANVFDLADQWARNPDGSNKKYGDWEKVQ